MDERDFAELISVFLKGGESTDTINTEKNNEQASTNARQPKSSEAEIRKNIIEALAEKIRESQYKDTPQSGQAEHPQTTKPDKTGSDDGAGIDNKTGGVEVDATMDMDAVTEQDVDIDDDLVTEEEVVTLLTGENQDKATPLQGTLDRFLKLDGVAAALLVSRDGFMVEQRQKVEFDLDMVSAIVATGFGSLDRIGGELDRSDLQIAMLEYLNGPIIMTPLVHDIVLVIVASQQATLGRVRWEIKKQTDELIVNL